MCGEGDLHGSVTVSDGDEVGPYTRQGPLRPALAPSHLRTSPSARVGSRIVPLWRVLGRVDGFEDDEAKSECDEGCKVLVRFLATECNALEALELADQLLDAGAGAIECLREERWPVLGR